MNLSNPKKKIKTEQRSSEETEDKTAEKVNEMLDSIIRSGNIEINLKLDEIEKEAKSWNRNFVSLICNLTTKYIKFSGTKEELIECITADHTEIASRAINNRQKKYNDYKNLLAIRKTLNNELKQIKSIIETRNDTVELEKDVAEEENEQIIKLLEDISSKPEDETEEEKQIIKTLECISRGEYNSEEEKQKIIEVLDRIALKEHTPKEEQKEKSKLQDKHKNTQRHIRSILSEIAQEFIKEEDYQVTYKTIHNKKQEIVDMVVDKLPVVTENEDIKLLRAREIVKDIVENVADVLIDSALDKTQHKGFKAVEEEIKKEAEHITSQDLRKSLGYTFRFIFKYTNLDLDGNVFLYDFKYSLSYFCIKQMIKVIISNYNTDITKLFLSNNTNVKLVDFLYLFYILCKLDEDIDNLKTYNEFWLNTASFNYYNGIMHPNHEFNTASIDYKNTISGKKQEKKVTPTDSNLQAFRRAKTAQDIEEIDE